MIWTLIGIGIILGALYYAYSMGHKAGLRDALLHPEDYEVISQTEQFYERSKRKSPP